MAAPWVYVGAVDVVRITSTSGTIEVVADAAVSDVSASPPGQLTVGEAAATIDTGSDRTRLRVPEGIDLVIGSTSGAVTVSGRVGSISVMSTSGRVEIEEADVIDVRAVSGRVEIGRASTTCRVMTTSGRIVVHGSGEAAATAETGRIELRNVRGPARAHTTSGRVDIELAGPHDVDAETVTGHIAVTVPSGVRARVVESPADVDRGEFDCVVAARSMSGRVTVADR